MLATWELLAAPSCTARGCGRRRLAHLKEKAGVGQLVLHGLKGSDGTAEGDSVLAVGQGECKKVIHGSDALRHAEEGSELPLVVDGRW